jgi:hypothetical protein
MQAVQPQVRESRKMGHGSGCQVHDDDEDFDQGDEEIWVAFGE